MQKADLGLALGLELLLPGRTLDRWTLGVDVGSEDSDGLPSGYVKIAIENDPVEIVDLPMKNGHFQ